MFTSAAGLQFIRSNEGLTLTVKGDAGGKQEIGYGHDLLPNESYPNGITEDFAEQLLDADVAHDEVHVNASIGRGATQNQFDALTDFTYECGPEALQQLLGHGWDEIPNQLPRWVHAKVGGVETILPGMVARRNKEVELFTS